MAEFHCFSDDHCDLTFGQVMKHLNQHFPAFPGKIWDWGEDDFSDFADDVTASEAMPESAPVPAVKPDGRIKSMNANGQSATAASKASVAGSQAEIWEIEAKTKEADAADAFPGHAEPPQVVAEDYTRNVVIPPEPTVHRNAQPDSQPITPLDMPEDCVYGWLGNKARELHAPLGAAYMVVASAKEMVLRTIVIASALFLASTLLFGQNAEQHPEWPGKGQLFVGTCYQPVDRSHEQIRQDIALMKRAGFTLVRMGDLSWDAFEPSQGHFEFAWFDQILEQMNSANNQWFDTPQPGRLSDVFGIRTEEFYRPSAPPEFILNRKTEKASIGFYEVLEPKTAKAMALFTNTLEKSPAITANVYRKGRAIYLAVPAQMAALAPIVRSLYPALAVEKGPETPSGVYARVVEGRTLYVNTTSEEKAVNISGSKRGIISGTSYKGVIRLKPYDADLVE